MARGPFFSVPGPLSVRFIERKIENVFQRRMESLHFHDFFCKLCVQVLFYLNPHVMDLLHKLESWGDTHQWKWLAFFRVLLGMIIFFKGLFFISHTDAINAMISKSAVALYAETLVHYVALAHLMGGLLIALGLLTRLAILFQLPILMGAIVFVNAQKGFYSIHSELGLSILILAMLLFFLVSGSGRFSVDAFMKTHEHT